MSEEAWAGLCLIGLLIVWVWYSQIKTDIADSWDDFDDE
jgi:hypothetical protein